MPRSNIQLGGQELKLDADADTSITVDTDDQIDIKIAGSDSLRIKANEIENVSGDFTLDVVGDITLDANGQQIYFAKNGTTFGQFGTESTPSTFTIESTVSDGDIVFKGSDGGSGITAMTIDMSAAGFVGIGTTAPTQKLTVNAGSTDTAVAIFTGNDTNRGLKISTATANSQTDMLVVLEAFGQHSGSYEGEISFKTANTERMRVDKSGNVGIGETSPANLLHVKASDVSAAPIDTALMVLEKSGTNYLSFMGANTNVQGVLFGDADDNDVGQLVYNHSSNTMDFKTNGSERMRIDSSGHVSIGTTSNGGGSILTLSTGSFTHGIKQFCNNGQKSLHVEVGGSEVGSISHSTSSTAFNTSSDYRLKENVITDWDATSRLKQLKPSRFNFKVEKDTTVDGFLAHEVSSIVPEAITGEKDGTQDLGDIKDKDGNVINKDVLETETKKDEGQTWTKTKTENVYQGIDQSKLVPLLTKALQEAVAKIETLEAKVTALEAK